MNNLRFDRFTKRFANGISRRSVLKAATAGGVVSALDLPNAQAQQASPEATPTAEDDWLIVVNFSSVDVEVAEDGGLTITMNGIDSMPVAFTDRPERQALSTTIDVVVRQIEAASDDPLNADLVVGMPRLQNIYNLPIVLLSASHDDSSRILTIQASPSPGSDATRIADGSLRRLGGNLFIDNVSLQDGSCDCGFTCPSGVCCCGGTCDVNGHCCDPNTFCCICQSGPETGQCCCPDYGDCGCMC